MDNAKLSLVLTPEFIGFSADNYHWAEQNEIQISSYKKANQEKIKKSRHGLSSKEIALILVTQEFEGELISSNEPEITFGDLERSYLIKSHRMPKDFVGVAFWWCNIIVPLCAFQKDETQVVLQSTTVEGICDELYQNFMTWIQKNNEIKSLQVNDESGSVNMIELNKLFLMVVENVLSANGYLEKILDIQRNRPYHETSSSDKQERVNMLIDQYTSATGS